jgi:putative nucleotidyltransferase with HDIG domain
MEHRGGAQRLKAVAIMVVVAILTAVHFSVPRATHELHVIHIVLAGMYVVPIIGAALWFGLRGSLAVTALISVAYYIHIRLSWPNQPMVNANQYAMIAVYWVIACVTGALVNLEEKERARRQKADREVVIESIAGLSNALNYRDEYTRRHSEHVSRLGVQIGTRLDLSPERLEVIRLAGLVHDIGKIGVRDDVLLKPQELTEKEWTAIRQHPIIAAEILRPIYGAREIASIVLAHHECPDGSGYPRGLKGEEIPIEARIIRVADVFASLVEERPYKPASGPEQAMAVLDQLAGSKVDGSIVRALRQLVNDGAPVL